MRERNFVYEERLLYENLRIMYILKIENKLQEIIMNERLKHLATSQLIASRKM